MKPGNGRMSSIVEAIRGPARRGRVIGAGYLGEVRGNKDWIVGPPSSLQSKERDRKETQKSEERKPKNDQVKEEVKRNDVNHPL